MAYGDDIIAELEGGEGVGNVQDPILSRNLRNSLLSLDSWQHVEREADKELEISALQDELASTSAQLEESSSAGIELSKWQIGMIAGVIITLIAISVFIFKRVK